MDAAEFLKQFQDYLAPRLDAYEQAIYLYIFRHSRLIGQNEVTIGFKSARKKMAFGIGEKGKPMAESTADLKLQSLQEKHCIEILGVELSGRRIRLRLPSEMPDLIPAISQTPSLDLEQMDFFEVPENRPLLLERERHHCFYCLRKIDSKNYVIEHVVSRPGGDNSYRNLVAACLQCNNRKGSTSAEDFIRTLYRECLLSSDEFEDRLSHLERLRNGELKPIVDTG
jgi:hypothetical protein